MIWKGAGQLDTWNVRPVANQVEQRRNPTDIGGVGLHPIHSISSASGPKENPVNATGLPV